MRIIILLISITVFLSSCFKYNDVSPRKPLQKVWGNKPVFALRDVASEIAYIPTKQPVNWLGNIYAYGPYIFQLEIGKGIHIIDNHDPPKADRVGFITVNGCQQISIKGAYLYTNSYSDLVTIDIGDVANLKLTSRVKNAIPSAQYSYPYAEPADTGYYVCQSYIDSVVVGWVKDSIYTQCYKY